MARRLDNALTATFTGLADRWRHRADRTRARPRDRLDGLRCLVTGASRGLGAAIARQLGSRGAELSLPCRREHDEVAARVRRETGAVVTTPHVELSDIASITAFVETLEGPFDRVVCNAGLVTAGARRSPDGFDTMVAVNLLAKVALLGGLLERGLLAAGARVVVVSSEAHRSAPPFEAGTIGRFEPYGAAESVGRYGRSKWLLTTYAMELSRRHPELEVHTICPGAVDTEIAREAPSWSKPLLEPTMRLLFRAPERAAEPVVYLACAKELAGETGLYFHADRRASPREDCLDPDVGAALWDEAHALVRSVAGSAES